MQDRVKHFVLPKILNNSASLPWYTMTLFLIHFCHYFLRTNCIPVFVIFMLCTVSSLMLISLIFLSSHDDKFQIFQDVLFFKCVYLQFITKSGPLFSH